MIPPSDRDAIRLFGLKPTTPGDFRRVLDLEGGNLRQRLVRGANHRLGVDVELLVDIGDLAGGAEAVHADKAAFEADIAFPAEFDRRFHRDARTARAENRLLVSGVLMLKEQAARHGDDRRRDALLLENFPRLDREMQFRAGAQDGELALAALGLLKNIAAPGRLVLVAGLAAEQRHRLAGEGDEGRLAWRVQNQLPALGGLDWIARAVEREVRDGAKCCKLFDRLMGWAVFAEA